MSNKSALLRKFVALGNWSPDAPEFTPETLDQIANAIPVFGVYRTMQRIRVLSVCPEARRVTGTYVHRISTDQSLDILQPDNSEATPPFAPKRGFQVVPTTLIKPPFYNQFFEALRGLGADASSYVMFMPRGEEVELFGTFSRPRRVWDNVNDLNIAFQYRIQPGFDGAYSFSVIIGTVTNPLDENTFVALTGGTFTQTGFLQVDGDGQFVLETFAITNANLPSTPHLRTYAWKLVHNIPVLGAGKKEYEAVAVASVNSADRARGVLTSFSDENDNDVTSEIVGSIGYGDDDTFIKSVPIYSNGGSGKGFWIKPDLPQLVNMEDHEIKIRFSVQSLAQEVSLAMFRFLGGQRPADLVQEWLNIGAAIPDTVPHQQRRAERSSRWSESGTHRNHSGLDSGLVLRLFSRSNFWL
jgi:hypothetical protein